MKKRTQIILIAVMIVALLSILLLQITWLSKGIDTREESFTYAVNTALIDATEKLRKKEEQIYFSQLSEMKEIIKNVPKKQSFTSVIENPIKNEYYVYKQEVMIEESYIPLGQLIKGNKDSLNIIDIYKSDISTEVPKLSEKQSIKSISPESYDMLTGNDYTIDRFIRVKGSDTPISERISKAIIDSILRVELRMYNLNLSYEFAVLTDQFNITSITTKKFKIEDSQRNYYQPLFYGEEDKPQYLLAIYFPDRNAWVKRPIIAQYILATVLLLTMIAVFLISLYYLQKQRKVAEVKTSFMNNITHEFKTPIATINIATAALKNQQVMGDETKIKHYADLIKHESERLNTQVEMVLRMARLEKNQIDLQKQKTELNALVNHAIDHIRLLVEHRDGIIFENYSTNEVFAMLDDFHFTNIVVNILENANKFSPEHPRINVKVDHDKTHAYISVEDQGIGMGKQTIKKIFEPFYRAETGNIHNVKGHGLGLAYVKKIVELHQGEINVTSEKEKGSLFVIKIPMYIS